MSKLRWLIAMLLAVALVPFEATAQERGTITGQVLEAGTQRPLPGAHVSIPALRVSAQTDEDGRFALSATAGTHTLRVQVLGYKLSNTSVTLSGTSANVIVTLETDPLQLDELVVVGYGEERRRNVGGSVASIKPEAVREVPATSINQILQGRLPGVQISQNSGTPGSAISVRVRGASSIAGGNEPLYVIDGVPMNQGGFSAIANVSFGGQDVDAISDLNAHDIERIEVLKDASAAAIYGSRASNGVVLITTRRGTSLRPEITFGAYYGMQEDWRRVDMLNAQQYLEIYNEGFTNRWGPASAEGFDAWYGYSEPGRSFWVEAVPGTDTDWLNEVLRTAPMSNFEGAIRGGTDRVRYYVSGSALDQEGRIRSMGFRRLNGRVNLDYQPFDRLTLGTNVALARTVTDRARSDNTIYSAWSNAIANPPIEPVFTADGDYYETFYANPVGMDREAEAEERAIRILGNVFGTYALMDGLTARLSVGLDQLTNRSRTYDSPTFGPWASTGGAAEFGDRFINKTTYEGTLNFNRALGAVHEFSGVAGGSYEDNIDESFRVHGIQFPTEYFKYVTSAATIDEGSSSRQDHSLISYFGRLSWTFAQKITTTFNVRRDGSSRFGENNRFGTFPSASVVWRVGEESFMQNQNLLRNFAVRASYGITGNQQDLGNFAARGLFGGGSNYMDQPGIAPSQLANPDLRWEKTKQLNVGTDFSVLNDRLALSFDYYDKKTDDLLVQLPVPRTTGYSSIWSNVGAMENKGFEVGARATLVRAAAFNWTTNVNLSRNRNKVTELFNDQPIPSGFASRVDEGEPLGFFYGFVTNGLFQIGDPICLTQSGETAAQRNARCAAAGTAFQSSRTAAGDIRFRDLNGDGIITSADQAKIGSPWPDYEGGITNTLAFGGFDLTAFVQFSVGGDIFNANRIYTDQYGSFGDNHTTRALDRWTPTNTDTKEPRAIDTDPNQNTRDSDRFIEDGTYYRLKNIVLGYTLPNAWAGRLGFRNARIYLQGQNVFTRTDYAGFDPEVNYSGQTNIERNVDFYTLPQSRTFTFGINVGF